MHVADLYTEDIAGEVKTADLATAVVQHPVGPHRAGNDLVEVFGRLVFAVNFNIAGKAHRCAHQTKGAFGKWPRPNGSGWTSVDRGFGDCSGGEHGKTPVSIVDAASLPVSSNSEIRVVPLSIIP